MAAHESGHWPRPLSAIRERIESDIEESDQDGFSILTPDETPVGATFLTDQNMSDGAAAVRLLVDPRHRSRSYGQAALHALTDLAFGELPLHRLEALPHTDNGPALGVLARAGFTHEGVRRAACLHRGRRYDLAMLSLLRGPGSSDRASARRPPAASATVTRHDRIRE
ncbi:GNAT family N-acetyltransferase [Kitasatospora griseola]|uniref:GNAT family N-acetyltransferase n=1 Tax=Kitasatospora griseola TaxID=2064 RepID=UPI0036DF7683